MFAPAQAVRPCVHRVHGCCRSCASPPRLCHSCAPAGAGTRAAGGGAGGAGGGAGGAGTVAPRGAGAVAIALGVSCRPKNKVGSNPRHMCKMGRTDARSRQGGGGAHLGPAQRPPGLRGPRLPSSCAAASFSCRGGACAALRGVGVRPAGPGRLAQPQRAERFEFWRPSWPLSGRPAGSRRPGQQATGCSRATGSSGALIELGRGRPHLAGAPRGPLPGLAGQRRHR